MVQLLRRGSKMSQLYLEYLKCRSNGDKSAVVAILASIKSMIAERKSKKPMSVLSQKNRFKAYQKGFLSFDNSINPSTGA